jgi:hypothetical protein
VTLKLNDFFVFTLSRKAKNPSIRSEKYINFILDTWFKFSIGSQKRGISING